MCTRDKIRLLRKQNKTLQTEKDLKCSVHCSVVFSLFLFRFCSVCYDRAPWYPTALTFILSALWHGIYPGYYFTFLTGILITLAARAVCTFRCSLLRPMLDTIQLSTAGTTLTRSSSLSPLWALFYAFAGLKFTETLFCIDAHHRVPPAVISSTSSARTAVLSLAGRGNVAGGCTVGSATGCVHAVKLAWDSRSRWSPDFS